MTYNNAHVAELRCVIIGNFGFSNRHQSEEAEIASFKVLFHNLYFNNFHSIFVKYITL